MSDWKLLDKKDAFKNKWRHMQEWKMRTPNGNTADFYIQVGRDIVTLAGVAKDNKFLILREFYVARQEYVSSLVGGVVDNENHKKTAENELREEAGCAAEEFIYLGSAFMGKYNCKDSHFYLALGIEKKFEQDLEINEDIQVFLIGKERFIDMVKNNELQDIHSKLCAYRALDYLKLL